MRKSFAVLVLVVLLLALTVPAGAQDETPALTVSDQASVNGMVVIDSVTANANGWVVVHADVAGSPGPVIGIAPVAAGAATGVGVMIDMGGATPMLHVALHVDDTTMGAFEHERNPAADPPVMAGDQPLMAAFGLTGFRAYDQMINEGSLVVAAAVVPQEGWAVVHADEGGQPGAILGQAPLRAGTSAPVMVPLSGEATPAVWVMLHVDDGEVGTFEFGEAEGAADPPFMFNEQPVMAPINITAEPTLMTEAGTPITPQDPALVPMLAAAEQVVEGVGQSDTSGMNSVLTIDTAVLPVAGWIDVHADNDGHPGASLGMAPAPAGQNQGVAVPLNPAMTVPGSPIPVTITPLVWPMLHIDDNQPEVYEFMVIPGADLPIVYNGMVVSIPVAISDTGDGGGEAPPAATEAPAEPGDGAPAATEPAPDMGEDTPAATEPAPDMGDGDGAPAATEAAPDMGEGEGGEGGEGAPAATEAPAG